MNDGLSYKDKLSDKRLYVEFTDTLGGSPKVQPVLLPASTLPSVENAFHVAPPVATMSLIDVNETALVPLLSLKVACVPAVVVSNVIRLPDVPETPNALTVCVVPATNRMVAG